MSFWNKLFGKTKKEHPIPKIENKNNFQLPWIESDNNPWKIRLLDLRPVTQNRVSTSQDPRMAMNAVSYNQEDGLVFLKESPKSKKISESNISFPIDNKLEHGVLFIPSRMENKWAIFFHENKILFVRSWTREVLVIAETITKDNELIVNKIHGEFTENESKEFTESIIKFLIHSHAMNEIVPAPIPKDLQTNTEAAGLWSFSVYGNMAHFGHFESTVNYQTEKKLRSHSLLHIAIARGDLYKIEKELSGGANINALAADGLSILQWAIATNTEILEYLLNKGIDPNIESIAGVTPIMSSVQFNKMDHLKLLIMYKGDVNKKDKRGFTALHRAAEMGHVEIVKELLKNGADKNIETEGHTALSLATGNNNVEIMKLLK